MQGITEYIVFLRGFSLRSKHIGRICCFIECFKYYRRYVKLPRRMGFSGVGLKYRILVIYSYFKYCYYLCEKPYESILDYVPRILQRYTDITVLGWKGGYDVSNKLEFNRIMSKNGLSMPETYFYSKDNVVYSMDDRPLTDFSPYSGKKIFAKKIHGSAGKGTYVFTFDGNQSLPDGYLFQENVKAHRKIVELAGYDILHTIRLHSYQNCRNDIEIISAHLKIVFRGVTDHLLGGGGIGIRIDARTGTLAKYGLLLKTREKMRKSPHSDIEFEGFEIPHWDRILKEVVECHRLFAIRHEGWDIGVTDKGIVFCEGNNNGGHIFVSQVIADPYYTTSYIQDQIIDKEARPAAHSPVIYNARKT